MIITCGSHLLRQDHVLSSVLSTLQTLSCLTLRTTLQVGNVGSWGSQVVT